ncbi:hypothetical protein CI238_02798 [Colletotrichum incanum]|uniref:Uncharacterized protein n=1 Tax=Colletotrichum incanum TaxID=1573173 RepID=A0A167CH62_COLIC|nr:hypothetical protein CI238_02798 [Colletotrichum incanum]OHW89600.1 hypothetical protein CSPAE12_11823 [Colletotrichum incanum]
MASADAIPETTPVAASETAPGVATEAALEGTTQTTTDTVPVHEVAIAADDTVPSHTHSASVTASILGYRQENGKTYHTYKDGSEERP